MVKKVAKKKKETKKTKEEGKKTITLGEAVGVIAAQSIGEPGTQMSLLENEKILLKSNNKIKIFKIGEFVDSILKKFGFQKINGSEVYDLPKNKNHFVLSLNQNEKVKWKRIISCIRHKSPKKLIKITTCSGRKITATDYHSFIIRKHNKIIPIAGKKLKIGDRIPVIKYLPENCNTSLRILDFVDSNKYFIENSYIDSRTSYNFKKLPETLFLNDTFGWFIGAYLAEGSCSKNYVKITNINEKFLLNAKRFAQILGIGFGTRSYQGAFGPGKEVVIHSSLLAQFIESICDRGSNNKKVPEFAYSASEKFVSGLLRGYFDGDGNVHVKRKMIRASSNSEDLIDGVKLLLTRFKIFAHKFKDKKQYWLLIPYKYAPIFLEKIGSDIKKKKQDLIKLAKLAERFWKKMSQDYTDMITGFDDLLYKTAKKLRHPTRYVNNFTKRQKIGRTTLYRYIKLFEKLSKKKNIDVKEELKLMRRMYASDVLWDKIINIYYVKPSSEYVYDLSVKGLETFTTFDGIVTHNTMKTKHVAGILEMAVTLGLPRLIEIFDARREPSTPMMTIHLKKSVSKSESKIRDIASKILEVTVDNIVDEISMDLISFKIKLKLNKEKLDDFGIKKRQILSALSNAFKNCKIKSSGLDISIKSKEKEMEIRDLYKLKVKIKDTFISGVPGVTQVFPFRRRDEFIIKTAGSNLKEVFKIKGVDKLRTFSNDIFEIQSMLGIEAARNAIIKEVMSVLKEQGLEVNIRHIMLVADTMTADGEIKGVRRYGVTGEKASVLARASFEVPLKHLFEAACRGEVDNLKSVVENVMINQPIPIGTGIPKLIVKKKGKK